MVQRNEYVLSRSTSYPEFYCTLCNGPMINICVYARMPKYYCDYCDTYLTHDSPSVRKTHNGGRKHKEAVRLYYTKWIEEQAQSFIDQTTASYKAQMGSGMPPFFMGPAPGVPGVAIPPPGQMSMMPPPPVMMGGSQPGMRPPGPGGPMVGGPPNAGGYGFQGARGVPDFPVGPPPPPGGPGGPPHPMPGPPRGPHGRANMHGPRQDAPVPGHYPRTMYRGANDDSGD